MYDEGVIQATSSPNDKGQHDAGERCWKKRRQIAVEEAKQKRCHHQALPRLASFEKTSEYETPKQNLLTDRGYQG